MSGGNAIRGPRSSPFSPTPTPFIQEINFFFLCSADRHRVLDCSIGTRDVSDHSGVYLKVYLDSQPKTTIWRLNTALLNDNKFEEFINKEFTEYVDFNNSSKMSPSIVWETAKASTAWKNYNVGIKEEKRKI